MAAQVTNFSIDFHAAVVLDSDVEKCLVDDAEHILRKLAKRFTDVTRASITILEPIERSETSRIFLVRVVLVTHPSIITAVDKHEDVHGALRGALKAAARHLRDKHERL